MLGWWVHRRNREADPKERAVWGDLMSLGMVFPLCIVLGWLGGRWIGRKLGFGDIGALVGLAWGIAAAFWELYKTARRLERMDPPPGDPPKDPEV